MSLLTKKTLLKCEHPIDFFKVYPFLGPHLLVAVGSYPDIHIYELVDLDKDGHAGEINSLAVFNISSRVTSLSWSPDTNLHSAPQILKFYTVCSDHKIRCIESDMKESTVENVVGQHNNYINSIAIHPEMGDCLASVGDDEVCYVWMAKGASKKVLEFPLTSPGMSVCWHPREVAKLMVAEKSGLIRFYSTETKTAFMSLDCGQSPLVSAHWSLANPLHVAAVAGSDLFVFDTSRSSQPSLTQKINPGGGFEVVWCPSLEYHVVTVGGPRFQVKMFDVKTLQVTSCSDLKTFCGIDVHPLIPLLFIVDKKEVQVLPLVS